MSSAFALLCTWVVREADRNARLNFLGWNVGLGRLLRRSLPWSQGTFIQGVAEAAVSCFSGPSSSAILGRDRRGGPQQ